MFGDLSNSNQKATSQCNNDNNVFDKISVKIRESKKIQSTFIKGNNEIK